MLEEPRTEPRRLQVGWAVPATGPVRTRWDYLRLETAIEDEHETVVSADGEIAVPGEPIEAALESLGNTEWELISVTPRGSNHFLYTFKRPSI